MGKYGQTFLRPKLCSCSSSLWRFAQHSMHFCPCLLDQKAAIVITWWGQQSMEADSARPMEAAPVEQGSQGSTGHSSAQNSQKQEECRETTCASCFQGGTQGPTTKNGHSFESEWLYQYMFLRFISLHSCSTLSPHFSACSASVTFDSLHILHSSIAWWRIFSECFGQLVLCVITCIRLHTLKEHTHTHPSNRTFMKIKYLGQLTLSNSYAPSTLQRVMLSAVLVYSIHPSYLPQMYHILIHPILSYTVGPILSCNPIGLIASISSI